MPIPDLTSYGGFLRDAGYSGGLVDQNPFVSESMTNDQATAIQFGYAVARSAAGGTCKAPAADTDEIIGVALRFPIRPTSGASVGGTNTVQYARYDSVPVLKEGYCYAEAFENVTRGDKVAS